MGFITLAPGVVFDVIDGEGCLICLVSGDAYALDPLPTMLLQVGLTSGNLEDAVAAIHPRVDADEQQVAEGFQLLYQQMLDLYLIDQKDGCPLPSREARGPALPRQCVTDTPAQRISSNDVLFQEFFLTGQLTHRPLPQIFWWKRVLAIWHVTKLLVVLGQFRFRAYLLHRRKRAQAERQAWRYLCQTLARMSRHRIDQEGEVLACLARRELVYCQLVVRLLAPLAHCLMRSAAFCTYLRSLGLPAHLVIGRPLFHQADDRFAFHAWTELAGRIVNDHAELQSGYSVIQRLPLYEEAEQ